MGLLDKIAVARASTRDETRYALDQYISDYLIPSMSQFNYNGNMYPFGGVNQTQLGQKAREISHSLVGYSVAAMRCPPVFAAQMIRALVISQARFTFRNRSTSTTPRRTFGTTALGILEKPWTNATTGELLARMEWHAGLAGNAFVTNWEPGRLRVLRPDWTAIVYGSQLEPEDPGFALDGEVVGYAYQNGGFNAGNSNPVRTLRPEEVAHWSPLPDPLSPGLGMSWVTPGVRDIQSDQAATEHKLRFFENGATPNMVVKGIPAKTKEQFDSIIDEMEANHTGIRNAYRTFYLTAGADVEVVGSNLQQLDFKETQGRGETRLAMLSRVPAPILQISEGLSGSSLNAGNFQMARRLFADSWIYPTLQDLAHALAPLVSVPADAELWFDVADMPMLREDAKDAAEIEQIKEATIVAYVNGGFTPESAVAAVQGQSVGLLKHTGLVSVQLQPPGTMFPAPAGSSDAALTAGNGNGNGNGKSPAPPPPPPSATRDAWPPITIHNHPPESKVDVVFQSGAIPIDARTTIEEGAIQATHSIEPGAFPIDARTTIAEGAIQATHSIEAGAFPVDARTTIEEGAVDARTTIEEGAIQSTHSIEPGAFPVDARTTFEEGAIPVDARTTIEEGAIRADTNIEEGAIRSEHQIVVPPELKPKRRTITTKHTDGSEIRAVIEEEE